MKRLKAVLGACLAMLVAFTTVSIACQWLASSESDAMLLDMLNLGMSPASLAVFGSNEPFNQWQLHSGELIALLTAKDFE